MSFLRALRSLSRLREVANLLFKEGFDEVLEQLHFKKHVTLERLEKRKKPENNMPLRLRRVMEEAGGAFVKLGQLLSLRSDLIPQEYCDEFSKLQDSVKPVPFSEVKKIIEEESFVKPAEGKPATLQHLTKTQDETITAIERNAGKLAFNSMIRIVYTAPIDIFDKMKGMGLIGSLRHFASKNLNGIRPKWFSGIEYPWKDFRDTTKKENQRSLLDAYKRRSFFDVPYKHLNGEPYILTTEELATLYHFPGAVVTTPTLTRAGFFIYLRIIF